MVLLQVVECILPDLFLIHIAFNYQVWNRPYANTTVNQAVNLLNHNSRSNTSYSLPQNQPTADSMQNNVSGQGDILNTYPDPNILYSNRNSRINPIPTNDPSYYPPPNIQLNTESYSMPQSFHEMSPHSPSSVLPSSNRASIFEDAIDCYSSNYAQPSPINAIESSSPHNSETFVEVLPSEITCPACILQVKYKSNCSIQSSFVIIKIYSVLKTFD